MKIYFAALIASAVLVAVPASAQSGSGPGGTSPAQPKKIVIDNDNFASAIASGKVQNAAATSNSPEDKKNPAFIDDDGNPLTATEEISRRKEEEKGWMETLEACKKSMESAQADKEREIWKESIASTESKLAKTRQALADAEASLAKEQGQEADQGTVPSGQSFAAPVQNNAGNAPE